MEPTDVQNGSVATTHSQRRLTIAVADDVAEIRTLAKIWLGEHGHHVLCAENGRALLHCCDTQRVDVVITDVIMPERDGFEVIREIRSRHPSIRIISMSGGAPVLSAEQSLQVARALGAHSVLRKPFNQTQLLAALAAVGEGPGD